MSATSRPERTPRRTDLDWVRVGAFALLILYHVGMFYVPWEWDVKSPRILPWIQIPMDWSSPWRLLLLFLVSGAATRFMSDKLSLRALMASRSVRLLPPLLLTALIVVPPQAYLQVVEQFGYHGGFTEFLGRYFSVDRHFCRQGECLVLPNWKHLWFVAYLWIYTMLLVCALALCPAGLERLQRLGREQLSGWRLLLMPAGVLVLARVSLKHFFPETHDLVDDWYLHVTYLLGFGFGFLFATTPEIWAGFMALRRVALAGGVAAYGLYAAYAWVYSGVVPPPGPRLLMLVVYGFDQWAWAVAALGFARRYLSDRDGPARRYLTEAIFPYYIIHQTAIVVIAHNLAKRRLPLGLEVAILIAATVASCALTFEIVRRIAWLRPWFGLKRLPPAERPGAAAVPRSKPMSA